MDNQHIFQLKHNKCWVHEEDLCPLDSVLVKSIGMEEKATDIKIEVGLPNMKIKEEDSCELLSGSSRDEDEENQESELDEYSAQDMAFSHLPAPNETVSVKERRKEKVTDIKIEVGLPNMKIKEEDSCELFSGSSSDEDEENQESELDEYSAEEDMALSDIPAPSGTVSENETMTLGRSEPSDSVNIDHFGSHLGSISSQMRNGVFESQPSSSLSSGQNRDVAASTDNNISSADDPALPFCKRCNKYFKSMSSLENHQKSEYHAKLGQIANTYPCDICGRVFSSSRGRRIHLKEHEKKKSFTCDACGQNFIYEDDIRRHELAVHNKASLMCSTCGKSFLREDTLKKHMTICGVARHLCEVCGKGYTDKGQLKYHQWTHVQDKAYACDICDQKCKSERNLKKHKKTHEPKEKNIPCTRCGEKFSDLIAVKMHQCTEVMGMLPGAESYMCALCEQGFSKGLLLMEHMKSHNLRKSQLLQKGSYVCGFCGKEWDKKSSLRRHEHQVHSVKKPFKCGFCVEAFEWGSDLRKHKKEAHAEVRRFMCGVCKKTVLSLQQLEHHLATHLDSRPFKCQLCEKSFKRKSHLQSHQFQHGVEKKFVCLQCGKKYSQSSHLKVHKNKCCKPRKEGASAL